MVTFVIPHRVDGKTRLSDPQLAAAMLADVQEVARNALVVRGRGGQGKAVADALAGLQGPVTIVNSDLPCITRRELEQLTAAAPALVAGDDGTTNALALRDAGDFEPLYGPGSAARFERQLGVRRLDLPGLRDDVDTWDDLERVRERVGRNTREYLKELACV
jgi:2-phospho-L-lactate guanylyltransferase (CobY/MobA/RfbA family)